MLWFLSSQADIDSRHIWYMGLTACYVTLSWQYFADALLQQPFSHKKNFLIFICVSLFVGIWNNLHILESIVHTMGMYLAFLLLLMLVYRQSIRNAIYYMLIHYFALGYVSRLMGWFYRSLGGTYYTVGNISYWGDPWVYLATAAMTMLILFFVRFQIKKLAGYELKGQEFIYIMLLSLPLAYFCYSWVYLSVPFKNMPMDVIFIRATISIFAMEAMIGLLISRKQQHELVELRLVEQRLQEQYQRHLTRSECSELIMQKYHDMQKHLRLFQETSNQIYLEKHQAELKDAIDTFDSIYETGNATMDTVLSEAYHTCRNENIQLICMADGKLIEFMDPIDIWSIFGNALDNAIESTRSLTDTAKKIVYVKVNQKQHFLLMRFENYFEHPLHWQDGRLITSKNNQNNHGYGLKSIEYAVKKYHGNIKVTAEEQRFILTIMINR